MRRIILSMSVLLVSMMSYAQQEVSVLNRPYVSVQGEAYEEVTPDEIYVRFTLKERYDGKKKIELPAVDKELLKNMKSEGFDLKELRVADANLDYATIKRKSEDVLASKTYDIKLSSLAELNKLWRLLDDAQVQNATMYKVDISNREEVERGIRVKAVKNAQQKADDMLDALGEQVGKVLLLEEQFVYGRTFQAKAMLSSPSLDESASSSLADDLDFKKIRVECKVQARFGIQ